MYLQPTATTKNTLAAANNDTAAPKESQLSLFPNVFQPTTLVHCPGPADELAARTGKVRTRTTTAPTDDTNQRILGLLTSEFVLAVTTFTISRRRHALNGSAHTPENDFGVARFLEHPSEPMQDELTK